MRAFSLILRLTLVLLLGSTLLSACEMQTVSPKGKGAKGANKSCGPTTATDTTDTAS